MKKSSQTLFIAFYRNDIEYTWLINPLQARRLDLSTHNSFLMENVDTFN